jgi:hypothetical protein
MRRLLVSLHIPGQRALKKSAVARLMADYSTLKTDLSM